MSQLNLSNIKTVGFIPDFNPKKGYPELGFKKETIVKTVSIQEPIKETKVTPAWKKKLVKRLKWEKRKFKKAVGPNYKPTLITTNKLY